MTSTRNCIFPTTTCTLFTTIFVTAVRISRAYPSSQNHPLSCSMKLARLNLFKGPQFKTSLIGRMMGTDSMDPTSTRSISMDPDNNNHRDNNKDEVLFVDDEDEIPPLFSPWSKNLVLTKTRFRQHVNPLARQYQIPTNITDTWPCDGTFSDPSLPLHIDIGCAKGGFLLQLALERSSSDIDKRFNYLGLEIRPNVAQFAKQRISKWGLVGKLDFMGCNANVDLDRILTRYTASGGGKVELVSIQYPDPHFKTHHHKRRVVTPELVATLVKFLPTGGEIFIQSDVKDVLDHMRQVIRQEGDPYFQDTILDLQEYMPENPIGVMTEREISVLKKNLPVYRTVFRRTDVSRMC